jgi:hypothetical protein
VSHSKASSKIKCRISSYVILFLCAEFLENRISSHVSLETWEFEKYTKLFQYCCFCYLRGGLVIKLLITSGVLLLLWLRSFDLFACGWIQNEQTVIFSLFCLWFRMVSARPLLLLRLVTSFIPLFWYLYKQNFRIREVFWVHSKGFFLNKECH